MKKTIEQCNFCGRVVGCGPTDTDDDDMIEIRVRRRWYAWPSSHGKSRETILMCLGCQKKLKRLMLMPMLGGDENG